MWDGPESLASLTEDYGNRQQAWDDGGGEHSFAIEDITAPGQIIGVIGASQKRAASLEQVLVGYWLGEPSWGNGLRGVSVALVTHFAFAYLNVVRAFAEVFVGNDASRRVLEKNGYHLDGTLRHHILKRGEWRDRWFFTMLREEWGESRNNYRPDSERVTRL